MKRCPITYEVINDHEDYSIRGLRLLSPQLKKLNPLAFSAAELRTEAIDRTGKISLQGIQSKLSARLNIKEKCFELVDKHARYILKPQSEYYPEMPQNEAITMTLAETIGIEAPIHGLIYSKDNSLTYFIKRFDRVAYNKKLDVEDFTQLLELKPETKYEGSMEKVAKVISDFCSFPKIELEKLFKLTLFNFLIGNEDMHLKNFSLITRDQKIMLSPAYDLLNSTIAQKNPKEELALPLNGKKNNLRKSDFLDYFGIQRLGLNQNVITKITEEIKQAVPDWKILINHSFLSDSMQEKYIDLLEKRYQQLFS